MRISPWSWYSYNRFWSLWSLFFTTKRKFWSSFLNRMSILLILKWTWNKLCFSCVVNTSSSTFTKLSVSIIFMNRLRLIIAWSRHYFSFITTHYSTCLKLWPHWPTQLNILSCFIVICSWSWSNWSIFASFIIDCTHWVFGTFNSLGWDLISTRS